MRVVAKRLKSAILVDESNAMYQLHSIEVTGFKRWKKFYEAVEAYLKENYGDKMCTDFNFYGALPPKGFDENKYNNRYKFFEALQHDGIRVYRGQCYLQDGVLIEKGIDSLMALDVLEYAIYKFDYIIVFTGDADIVPAIERAQSKGSLIFAILARDKQAYHLRNIANIVIDLEDLIVKMEESSIVRKNTP
jgi:uncharacterized LabA/DUF88 family protein